ncbi:hypothetical protein NDA11_006561 [Ustilago hordei]|uniref:Uncharacterized protein n=1 Tax=Ustilago hordei TaxID=120017 RepID=I2G592_USTHO|nr:uncharacterized protein UHO2_01696 [Ustilago hordei]KAJ1039450.1 hypothetical protein NDA10_007368 [Ustilago hordei]KAJ1586152.1 hypothetical protein NDA12_005365 [Ustilago hordei]KAJ1588937.1 hypothetical protein NDA15_000645 [Ustilago hordei]KAJ1591154.1 hypothetical protein NDA11_006561 [Ustilago hordei]KAJ1601096.1 hypothetical protein NDA14_007048 [Ustilago hordei]
MKEARQRSKAKSAQESHQERRRKRWLQLGLWQSRIDLVYPSLPVTGGAIEQLPSWTRTAAQVRMSWEDREAMLDCGSARWLAGSKAPLRG